MPRKPAHSYTAPFCLFQLYNHLSLYLFVLLLCTFPVVIIPINSWGCVTIWMYMTCCWYNLILGVSEVYNKNVPVVYDTSVK